MMLHGIFLTLCLSILAWMIALVLGILIGICRIQSIKWLRFVGSAYVQVVRNVPLLVHVFLWYSLALIKTDPELLTKTDPPDITPI